MKRLLGMVICMAMLMALMTPAFAFTSEAPDITKEVKLIYYFPWGAQADQDTVFAEANKIIKSKINATVDFKGVDWGSWGQKMNLVMASGEDWDLTFTAFWTDPGVRYSDLAEKGALRPLNTLIAKYAPALKALPQKYWDKTKIDGVIYGAFNYQTEARQYAWIFNKKLVDKYKLNSIIAKGKYIEDFEPAFDVIVKKEKNVYPVLNGHGTTLNAAINASRHLYQVGPSLCVKDNDPKLTVFDIYKTKPYYLLEDIKRANRYLAKGYYKRDQMTIKDFRPIENQGKFFLTTGTYAPGSEAAFKARNNGLEAIMKPIESPIVDPNGPIATLTAINAFCKNPERAMMYLNLINSDKKLFNLIAYGIEGKHYNKIGANMIEMVKDSTYNPQSAWEFGNTFNAYVQKGQPANLPEVTLKFNDQAISSAISNFRTNDELIKKEAALLNGVWTKYQEKIMFGIGDPVKVYNDYVAEQKKAGLDKVNKEVMRQLDEYRKTLNQ